jgi:hypothetical protein
MPGMGKKRIVYIGYWYESQRERALLEDQDVDGWITLRLILGIQDRVVCTELVCLRVKGRALVNAVMNLRVL